MNSINRDAHRQKLITVITSCISERDIKKAEPRESKKLQPVSGTPAAQQVPTIVYQSSPTITALEVRKEKEAELYANDQYWANRLQNQEAEFLKNSKIMEKEFIETVSDGQWQ